MLDECDCPADEPCPELNAAQQPEAPPADDLAVRLMAMLVHGARAWDALAIEGAATRIRALEGDLGRYMMLANTNAAELASARERERAKSDALAWIASDAACGSLTVAKAKATLALATPDSAASEDGR